MLFRGTVLDITPSLTAQVRDSLRMVRLRVALVGQVEEDEEEHADVHGEEGEAGEEGEEGEEGEGEV